MSEPTKLREDHAHLGAAVPPAFRHYRPAGRAAAARIVRAPPRAGFDSAAHLKLEDWGLYPRLIDSGDPEAAAAGAMFKEEMGGLAPAFLAYSNKWNAATITADWAGYCATRGASSTRSPTASGRENRDLLPLLERLDRAA